MPAPGGRGFAEKYVRPVAEYDEASWAAITDALRQS